MHKMVKPSGVEVEVNENSVEYAKSLGWKLKPEDKPKRGRQSGNSAERNK